MEERFELKGDDVVLDRKTGLAWQRGASEDRMIWKDAKSYIQQLNEHKFAGCDDWRFPTQEEIATLILPDEDRRTGLYINGLFGHQRNVWTATEAGHHRALYADFYYGEVYVIEDNYANHFARAVRTEHAPA